MTPLYPVNSVWEMGVEITSSEGRGTLRWYTDGPSGDYDARNHMNASHAILLQWWEHGFRESGLTGYRVYCNLVAHLSKTWVRTLWTSTGWSASDYRGSFPDGFPISGAVAEGLLSPQCSPVIRAFQPNGEARTRHRMYLTGLDIVVLAATGSSHLDVTAAATLESAWDDLNSVIQENFNQELRIPRKTGVVVDNLNVTTVALWQITDLRIRTQRRRLSRYPTPGFPIPS